MRREEIEGVLDAYAAAKNSHDVDAILALCHDECWYESIPLGSRIEGKAALAEFYIALFAGLPDYSGDFDGVAYGVDSAVVWGRFGGTSSDDFMGVPVEAGRRIEIPVTFVCTFQRGLLTGDTGYFDAATLCDQVGVPLDVVRPSALASAPTEAADFVERFRRFWRNPSPDLVPELIAADAVAHWPGLEPIRGTEYPAHIAGILELAPDLRLEVTEHAEADEMVFISWRARATAGAGTVEWSGVDRFRVRDGRAVEALVVYDTMPLQQALERANAAQPVSEPTGAAAG